MECNGVNQHLVVVDLQRCPVTSTESSWAPVRRRPWRDAPLVADRRRRRLHRRYRIDSRGVVSSHRRAPRSVHWSRESTSRFSFVWPRIYFWWPSEAIDSSIQQSVKPTKCPPLPLASPSGPSPPPPTLLSLRMITFNCNLSIRDWQWIDAPINSSRIWWMNRCALRRESVNTPKMLKMAWIDRRCY